MSIDLHLHTNVSDGTDTPAELVKKLHGLGIYTFSLTDHDTVAGLSEARAALLPGMTIINGVELSSVYTDGKQSFKCHILGYGFDEKKRSICEAVAEGTALRKSKMAKRIDYLEGDFGISFSASEKEYLSAQESGNKLLLADLIIKKGLAEGYDDAIRRYLGGKDFPDSLLTAETAVNAIRASGGVAVFAHCLGGETERRRTAASVAREVDALCELGIEGLECFYSRYSFKECLSVLALARERGLAVSCGSDYHGSRKTVRLGQLSSDGYYPRIGEITLLDLLSDKREIK